MDFMRRCYNGFASPIVMALPKPFQTKCGHSSKIEELCGSKIEALLCMMSFLFKSLCYFSLIVVQNLAKLRFDCCGRYIK